MRRILLIFSTLMIIVISTYAQSLVDIVQLKNGDALKGTIIEYVPDDFIRMELTGGSRITIKFSDVVKWTREKQLDTQLLQSPKDLNETVRRSDIEKLLQFEIQKKSPAVAIVLSLLITSAGHAYAKQWERGLFFTAGRIGFAVLAFEAGIEPGLHGRKQNDWYTIGIIGIIVLGMWEAIDAGNQVVDYNESLYRTIIGSNRFNLNIVPIYCGTQLRFSLRL